MNVLEKQLLTIVEVIKKIQGQIKDNTFSITQSEKEILENYKENIKDHKEIKESTQNVIDLLKIEQDKKLKEQVDKLYIKLNTLGQNLGKIDVNKSITEKLQSYTTTDVLKEQLKALEKSINDITLKEGKAGKNGIDGRDGKDGEKGQDGRDGKDGIDGKTPEIDFVETETIPSSENADVEIIREEDKYGFKFKIPKGKTGLSGRGQNAKINGVNTLTITNGKNILTEQVEDVLTIKTTDELNVDKLIFNTNVDGNTLNVGEMQWNENDRVLEFKSTENVTIQIGQEMTVRTTNNTSEDIMNGKVVYINGAGQNYPLIELASASDYNKASKTIGVSTELIPSLEDGMITTQGFVRGIDTSLFTAGDIIFLGENGEFTNIIPTSPSTKVAVGVVVLSNETGTIFVNVQLFESLSNLSDVLITNLQDNDVLVWNSTTQMYENRDVDLKIKQQNELLIEPTGFTNSDTIIMTYNSTDRTITLNGTFEAYYKGELIPELTDGWVSEPHDDADGIYFLYYCEDGFIFDTSPWTFNCLQIAFVQYDGQKLAIRECHGFMQWQNHQEFHQTIGTYKQSGGTLITNSYQLNSSVATNRRPNVNQTVVQDEDLATTVPQLTSKLYTQRYLTGAGATRTFVLDQPEIIPISGTFPYWNQFTGGAWQQTLMVNNEYGAIFLVAIPTTADTQSQKYRYCWVQPQQVSATLSTIQALTPTSLNLGDSANLVSEFVFIVKIIIRVSGNNWTIHQVDNLSGTRFSQVGSPSGNYLSIVTTDTSLQGNGTTSNPIGLNVPNVTSIVSSATPTLAITNTDKHIYEITALAEACAFGNPTGTKYNGQVLIIRIKDDGTARALSFGTDYYAGTDVPMPTTTVLGKQIVLGFMYNSNSTYWELLAVTNNI